MNIEINRIGKIVSGKDAGQFLKIERDAESEKSYLIYTSKDFTFRYCFDNWFGDIECVRAHLERM